MERSFIETYTDALFGGQLHAKRLLSLNDGVEGLLKSATLGIHAIGRGLASIHGLIQKHAIKQVDRLIGNKGLNIQGLTPGWISHSLRDLREAKVNIDWTDFDSDDQAMVVIALQTGRGRSAPLLWKTVSKAALKDRMREYEISLLEELRLSAPQDCKITVIADRGFASIELLDYLHESGFNYIVRFKANFKITNSKDITKTASE